MAKKSSGPKPTGKPGFVKPASAAQNKRNPPKLASATKKMVPIKKKPGSNVINVNSKPGYIKGSGPSSEPASSYSASITPPAGYTPPAPTGTQSPVVGGDSVFASLARSFTSEFEGIRNSPSSTTNGMTGVDDYKNKSLKGFMDFGF